MNASVFTETNKEFFSCCCTKWQENVVLKYKIGKFYDKCHRHRAHQSNGAAEKAVSTVRGLARTYLAVLKDKILSFEVTDNTFADAVDYGFRYPVNRSFTLCRPLTF